MGRGGSRQLCEMGNAKSRNAPWQSGDAFSHVYLCHGLGDSPPMSRWQKEEERRLQAWPCVYGRREEEEEGKGRSGFCASPFQEKEAGGDFQAFILHSSPYTLPAVHVNENAHKI